MGDGCSKKSQRTRRGQDGGGIEGDAADGGIGPEDFDFGPLMKRGAGLGPSEGGETVEIVVVEDVQDAEVNGRRLFTERPPDMVKVMSRENRDQILNGGRPRRSG